MIYGFTTFFTIRFRYHFRSCLLSHRSCVLVVVTHLHAGGSTLSIMFFLYLQYRIFLCDRFLT